MGVYSEDVVGIKLPNGQVKVLQNKYGSVNEIYSSESEFYSKFQSINEGVGVSIKLLESING